MKAILFTFVLIVLLTQAAISQGWEQPYTLPVAVAGATSATSEGYGVHLVGVYSGVAKHFWVGNDNTVVWSTLAVTGGQQPQVTFYDGQVRVVMKVTVSGQQKLRLYQSDDGGYAWTVFPDFTPDGNPPIFHLYAYSDRYGTHVVWDNGNVSSGEVYYVRFNEQQQFANFNNVTDLASPSQGWQPKVSVVQNRAVVMFHRSGTDNGFLTSRDLNISTGGWDNFYRLLPGGYPNHYYNGEFSAATIGDTVYAIGVGYSTFEGAPLVFTRRWINATSWEQVGFVGGYTTGNQKNMLVASGGLLQLIWVSSAPSPYGGAHAMSYSPSAGWNWGDQVESNESFNSFTNQPFFITAGQYGTYYVYTYQNLVSQQVSQRMRRRALVPTVTISAPVASGWNMTGIATAAFNLFKSQVYPTAISDAWRYEGGYHVTDPLSNRRGWWIKFPSTQNIGYTGARIDSMRMIVTAGWNIIGSISSAIPASSPNVTSDPPGIITSPFYKYSKGGYVPVSVLEPGGGYWMSVNQNGRVVLKVGSGQGPGDVLGEYDRFTLVDSEGMEQDLYVRNADLVGTSESLEMPPPPPDAEFDARFLSGDIIRTVDPEEGAIDLCIAINEATYPVTFTWEINPENGITYTLGGGLGKAAQPVGGSGSHVLVTPGERIIRLAGKSQRMRSSEGVPNSFALHQNYPNPFNPNTTLRYALPEEATVSLRVYDVLGREVMTLADGSQSPGYHSRVFDGRNLASGVYLARLIATDIAGIIKYTNTRKLILTK